MVNMLKKCNLAKLVATDIFLEANSASILVKTIVILCIQSFLPYPFVRHTYFARFR